MVDDLIEKVNILSIFFFLQGGFDFDVCLSTGTTRKENTTFCSDSIQKLIDRSLQIINFVKELIRSFLLKLFCWLRYRLRNTAIF